MNEPMHGQAFDDMYEWKQNYHKFCMRKPNVEPTEVYVVGQKNVYTDAYGETKNLRHTCRDEDS